MSSPDQRLPIDHEQLAIFGRKPGFDGRQQHRAALALFQRDVGETRVRDAALADGEAAIELDLVATVEQALEGLGGKIN